MNITLNVLIDAVNAMRLALDSDGLTGEDWMKVNRAWCALSVRVDLMTEFTKVEVKA
jgi:hypothetical protein